MPLPAPEAGLVISYAYLWRHDREAGHDEGRKNRPCVVVLVAELQGQATLVTVAPITHLRPTGTTVGVAIPPRVKAHLRLDDAPSWVIVSEVNQFAWPGYDLRPMAGEDKRFAYGLLPPTLFDTVKSRMLDLMVQRRTHITRRD